jgi:ribosome-associated protein
LSCARQQRFVGLADWHHRGMNAFSAQTPTSSAAAIDFALRGEFIPLDALLKATGLASSGGQARALISAGEVQVGGQTELRKTCKIRSGQQVRFAGTLIRVR